MGTPGSAYEASRTKWDWTNNTTHEAVQTGCLQRIADASELIAKNYSDLLRSRDFWEKTGRERLAELEKANRRIAALQGVITKMKNKANQ